VRLAICDEDARVLIPCSAGRLAGRGILRVAFPALLDSSGGVLG